MEPTTTTKTASQLLNECANVLENGTVRWGQRGFFPVVRSAPNETGCGFGACAWGVLYYCSSLQVRKAFDAGNQPSLGELSILGMRAEKAMYEAGMSSRWNDDPIRTKEEVIAKFREAANFASSKEQ